MGFGWTIVALIAVLAVAWRFLGSYMAAVFEGRVRWLSFIERPVYRLLGVDPESEQSWRRYATSLIAFSGVAMLVTYLIFRLQGVLPFNPQHLAAVTPALAWNTSVSFVTNTNWQAYSGETTMSYLSQMGAGGAELRQRGRGHRGGRGPDPRILPAGAKTIGNFWVDLIRATIYVLLSIAFVAAVVFIAQGAVQTLAGPA